MADIFPTSDDKPAVPGDDTAAEDRAAEDTTAEPIVIRKLDRLETTLPSSQNGG
jgi:hypothetical protein